VQLVSKISDLCGPDPPTLQTDGQTDVMQSQYRALHYSASRGKSHQLTGSHHANDIGMPKYHPRHAEETNAVQSWQSAAICRSTLNRQDPQTIHTNRKRQQIFPYGIYKDNKYT